MTDSEGSQLRTRASLLFRLQQAPDDPAAWDQFVARYGPQIAAWCRHWGLQEADAADVTQNVLLQLTQKLRDFYYDPSKRFRAWLKTLARHAWSDFYRAGDRAGAGGSAALDVLDRVAARDDLDQRLLAAFDHELLERAYEQVRARVEGRTWQAFVLTAVEGQKGAEAAHRLGMNVGAVFVAKSKVQAMLQEFVRASEEEP
ncbi:sigma-70 family RNA polymerase sigma factor [Gemmata sp. G18]|uniref:Sigma-70 family RNA polymerase sigma factor n=1 Tax=Gemmata palustris TaxID=2822762 RepID=A0ABS5BSR9_9BACT|nr:sigma-70 family RNA polymerase sigma factor [Gemmata palustris]MBP3956778.1 sigma-70 family RNA polymerase sigma factor [Gemmata palustris]